MSEKFDIFFSYDHDDAKWADRLGAALRERGFRVWIDAGEIAAADRWAQRLETGLKSSRIYALVVTKKALQSRWVMDEYYSALALANSAESELQLVPLLVEDVKLPVFLSIRQWVDFRQPEKFGQSLEQLCQGILAARAKDSLEVRPRESGSAEAEGTVTLKAQLQYLGRALRREAQTIREMWAVRAAAAAIGLAIYSGLVSAEVAPGGLALALGNTLVTGLIGWGATAQRMTAARLNKDRLTLLLEGLELCQGRSVRELEKLQHEFWKVVHGNAGLAAA